MISFSVAQFILMLGVYGVGVAAIVWVVMNSKRKVMQRALPSALRQQRDLTKENCCPSPKAEAPKAKAPKEAEAPKEAVASRKDQGIPLKVSNN